MTLVSAVPILSVSGQFHSRLQLELVDLTLTSTSHGPFTSEIDDASTSSTLTVDRVGSHKSLLPSSSSSGKQVRFALQHNDARDNVLYPREDCGAAWYTAADYRHFKASTLQLAKEIARAEADHATPFSYHGVLLRAYEVCVHGPDPKDNPVHPSQMTTPPPILTLYERQHLTRWAKRTPARVGLERWSCRPIHRDKAFRRHQVVDVVLDSQELLRCRPDNDNNTSITHDADERLRQLSLGITRPSGLFAQCLAQAQASAGDEG
jgi:hypothetical protein